MKDSEFKKLKKDIENKTNELNKLQDEYRNQTGRNHIVPLYLYNPNSNEVK